MILEQVRDEMNQVNWVLDELDSVRGRFGAKKRRAELIQRATMASIRGVEALRDDILTREPIQPWSGIFPEVREAMRQDRALMDAFVAAECRLLEDMGVDPKAVAKIRNGLNLSVARILTDETVSDRERSRQEFAALADVLGRELLRVQGDADRRDQVRKLRGVLLALGGGVVVVSNGLVGAGLTPVTGGLSAAGAALSGAVGEEMISLGLHAAIE